MDSVQYGHHLDGCVRQGNWLNISLPWVSEVQELWPCYQEVQPGSYFVGAGFAVFNTSGGNSELDFHRRKKRLLLLIYKKYICLLLSSFRKVFPLGADGEMSIELWGNFSKMDGTILSIKPLGQERMFSLVTNNETKVCS